MSDDRRAVLEAIAYGDDATPAERIRALELLREEAAELFADHLRGFGLEDVVVLPRASGEIADLLEREGLADYNFELVEASAESAADAAVWTVDLAERVVRQVALDELRGR